MEQYKRKQFGRVCCIRISRYFGGKKNNRRINCEFGIRLEKDGAKKKEEEDLTC